tara:strand:+ start:79 stop:468 length:390 start_codon:yes stop_codon:yes gene_type:complete
MKWSRNSLKRKYEALKILEFSQRSFGDNYIPKFREIARELNMTPQNLHFLWKNRDSIEKRAKSQLSKETIDTIENLAVNMFLKEIITMLHSLKKLEYDKLPINQLRLLMNSIFDNLLKIYFIEKGCQSV